MLVPDPDIHSYRLVEYLVLQEKWVEFIPAKRKNNSKIVSDITKLIDSMNDRTDRYFFIELDFLTSKN